MMTYLDVLYSSLSFIGVCSTAQVKAKCIAEFEPTRIRIKMNICGKYIYYNLFAFL